MRHLHEALSAAGREPAWDQDNDTVPFGAPYRSEIAAAIAESEKFIFVISPDSLDSGECAWELAKAVSAKKQIIPLLRRAARESQPVPDTVTASNWIFFNDDAEFDRGFGQLIQALDTDLPWVRQHTRLLVRAREWAANDSDRSGLLRGAELRAAESWLAGADAHPVTPPTRDQGQFITASRRAADRAAGLQRSVLAIGLAIAVALASVAFFQRNQANRARDQAIYQETLAEALQLNSSDTPLAAQLNLAAFRMDPSSDVVSRVVSTENTPLSSPLADSATGVSAVAFSPDGRTLAAGSYNGTVRLWDVSDPARSRVLSQPLTHTLTVYSLAFSPDGRILADGDADGILWLWDVSDPAHPRVLSKPEASGLPIFSVAFSPDGRTLAFGGIDGTILLWDVSDPLHPRRLGLADRGGGNIYALAFSRAGHMLASGDAGGVIQLWDVSDTAYLRPIGQHLPNTQTVYSLAFSRDSRTLATVGFNGTIRLWGVADPTHPQALGQLMTGSTDSVNAAAFSPDGRTLATGGFDAKVRLWDVADPAHPQALGQPVAGDTGTVHSLAFSPDGRTLASGSDNGTVLLWSLPPTVLTGSVGSVNAVAFSADGRTLATGGDDGVRLWDVANPAYPRPLGQLQPITGIVDSLAFSPDGRTLATGGDDGDVGLWDVADSAHPRSRSKPQNTVGSSSTLGSVLSLAFSPDGHMLAAGGYGGYVDFWNMAGPAHTPGILGQPISADGTVYSLAFSPDGRTLATGDSRSLTTGDVNGKVQLWDVANPRHPPLGRPLTSGTNGIYSVAFSRIGHVLASGDADGMIRLWDTADRAHPRSLTQPRAANVGSIYSLAFSPDGRTLASGDANGTIGLWDVTDSAAPRPLGQPLPGHMGKVYSVAFAKNSNTLASASIDETIRIWDLDVNYAIRRICATARNDLTLQQWQTYISQRPYQPPCAH